MPAEISRRRHLFYSALAVLIFFAAAELVFRIHDFKFYYNFSADLLGMPLLDMFRFRRIANNTVEFDQNLFWKFKPNQTLKARGVYLKPVRINNFGFRGQDFQMPKRPGSFRIVCLGDSVTFGWSAADDETYPSQLQALFKKKWPNCDIEVLNLGVTGYTSFQGKQLFFRFAQKLKPDSVIIGFGQNDRYPALLSDQEHQAAGTWKPDSADLLLRHSQVYKLLKSGVVYLERRRQGLSLDPKTYLPKLKRKVSEQEYPANLKAIADECKRLNCQVVILNNDFPSLSPDPALDGLKELAQKSGAPLPPSWQEWDALKLNEQAALETGAKLVDLRALFNDYIPGVLSGSENPGLKQSPWSLLMVDNGHPNQQGHQIIADRLEQVIAESAAFQEFQSRCPK